MEDPFDEQLEEMDSMIGPILLQNSFHFGYGIKYVIVLLKDPKSLKNGSTHPQSAHQRTRTS